MNTEYPVKQKEYIVDRITPNIFIEFSIEYEPIFKLQLIRRNEERPPYTHDIIGQSVTRHSMDGFVNGGSDGITREIATYLFETANDHGFDVELTDELMIKILDYKKELLREKG